MAKYLVIVESPAKVKTIKKFLGENYTVTASNGHVRDLPKSQLGIDVEHDYEPKYITIRGKGDILANLRKEVKKADKIYLATDPDREGEAISWHLYMALKLENKKVYRITFNEITKNAVKESLKNAREINMDLVDAQQARRALDRMVGYRISPLLWAKVKRGLSAGRVQSVALRIICDREDEINNFIPEEYWTLDASLFVEGEKKPLIAKYYGTKDGKVNITSREELDKIVAELKNTEFKISEVKKGERIKKAPLPFTTSTLQQEASKVLNFSTQKTMRLAQQLYEGIDIKGSGTVGVITYLRTDSTRVSAEAEVMAEKYIEKNYGKDYVSAPAEGKNSGQKIQDAHEAIRPTDLDRTPAQLKDSLSRDQFRLYQLIFRRFTASRMACLLYTSYLMINVLTIFGRTNVNVELQNESQTAMNLVIDNIMDAGGLCMIETDHVPVPGDAGNTPVCVLLGKLTISDADYESVSFVGDAVIWDPAEEEMYLLTYQNMTEGAITASGAVSKSDAALIAVEEIKKQVLNLSVEDRKPFLMARHVTSFDLRPADYYQFPESGSKPDPDQPGLSQTVYYYQSPIVLSLHMEFAMEYKAGRELTREMDDDISIRSRIPCIYLQRKGSSMLPYYDDTMR